MKSRFLHVAGAALALGMGAGSARAQHLDIWLQVADGRIVTSFAQDFQPGAPSQVFAGEFGDSGCAPFTANPGFNSSSDTFQPGSQLGWNALDGFKAWNGSAFEPTGGEFLVVSFFVLSFTVAGTPVDGFALNVPAAGSLHVHLDFEMNGAPAGCTPPAGADAGIYLLNLEVTSSQPGVAASEPFWIVFNYLDQPPEQIQQASLWVSQNLACHWDMDQDGAVDINDFLDLLNQWGTDPGGPPDFDGDGTVDINDFLDLLTNWGACP